MKPEPVSFFPALAWTCPVCGDTNYHVPAPTEMLPAERYAVIRHVTGLDPWETIPDHLAGMQFSPLPRRVACLGCRTAHATVYNCPDGPPMEG
jgi:hypothetical protein